jgi:hypothetical protein
VAKVNEFLESFAQLAGVRWAVVADRTGVVIASALHRDARPPHASLFCWPVQATGLGSWIAAAARAGESYLLEVELKESNESCDVQLAPLGEDYVLAVASDRLRSFVWDRGRVERAAEVLRKSLATGRGGPLPPAQGGAPPPASPASAAVVFAAHPGVRPWDRSSRPVLN